MLPTFLVNLTIAGERSRAVHRLPVADRMALVPSNKIEVREAAAEDRLGIGRQPFVEQGWCRRSVGRIGESMSTAGPEAASLKIVLDITDHP